MSLFSGIMSGSCMLVVLGTDTVNEYGETVPGTSTESGPYSCFFYHPDGLIINVQSGEHQKKRLRVMLPANLTLSVGQHIRGLVIGYSETYRILSVEPAHQLDVLDHWECDLEVVV